MGLYDRDYMRSDEPGYRHVRANPWSPTITLLVVLVVVFALQSLLHLKNSAWLEHYCGLSLDGIRHGRLWQLLTFQFLHGGILHILLNGFTLYSLGRFMEQVIGRNRFLSLYFLSGIAGGLLQIIVTLVLNHNPYVPMVGASAGIAGLLGAFAGMYPQRRLTIFIVVFPLNIRAQTLLWIFIGLSVVGTVAPFGGVAHAAHLGGILAGLAYVRFLNRRPVEQGRSYSGSIPPFINTSPEPPRPDDSADFIAREVDPILEKIATHGIHSLTDRERKILETARSRMGKR